MLPHPLAWWPAARASGDLPAGPIRPGAISSMMAVTMPTATVTGAVTGAVTAWVLGDD